MNIEYRRLRCPRCNFEVNRDVVGRLSMRKRVLKMLEIKAIPGELSSQMTDVNPNR